MTVRTYLFAFGIVASLATIPAMAQTTYPAGADDHRRHEHHSVQLVQGTIQSVTGTVAVLSLPMQAPAGTTPYYEPATMQIDFSRATFEGFDGSSTGPQLLQPGERVVVVVRPARPAAPAGPQATSPQYAPTWSNGNSQYDAGYAPPVQAFVIEPLTF